MKITNTGKEPVIAVADGKKIVVKPGETVIVKNITHVEGTFEVNA